jgi:hypothetical protein
VNPIAGLRRRAARAVLASLSVLLMAMPMPSRATERAGGLEATAEAMFLPASYVDLQDAIPLENFFGLVASKLITRCLRGKGFSVRFPYAPQTYNWSDANSLFPDLRRIARDGLLTPADLQGERDWRPHVPAGERRAFRAALASCEGAAGATERTGASRWFALEGEWFAADAAGESDPSYLRLEQRFGSCVRRAGYEGITPQSFLFGIDRLIAASQAAGEPVADQKSISLSAGKVYARCYRAANARRQAARRRALRAFLLQQAADVIAANRQLAATVARLSTQTGVTFDAEVGP